MSFLFSGEAVKNVKDDPSWDFPVNQQLANTTPWESLSDRHMQTWCHVHSSEHKRQWPGDHEPLLHASNCCLHQESKALGHYRRVGLLAFPWVCPLESIPLMPSPGTSKGPNRAFNLKPEISGPCHLPLDTNSSTPTAQAIPLRKGYLSGF